MVDFARSTLLAAALALAGIAFGQAGSFGQGGTPPPQTGPAAKPALTSAEKTAMLKELQAQEQQLQNEIDQANKDGVPVEIQSIAHYRGMRGFQLSGIGLVVGLENTGDTTKSIITQTLYANYFKSHGLSVDSTTVAAKNVALVQVTANMPAFTKPGTKIDVTVSSIGDAKSLQGGLLIETPLYDPTDASTVIVSAAGPLSIGGFNASGAGSTVQKNHVNVGRVPGGGEVQTRIDSQVVFGDANSRKLYLDLDVADPTTMSRIVQALSSKYPELQPAAVDSTTVAITVPPGADPADTMSRVDQTTVFADTPAKVVINERTGTIVVGGNVTIGPAMIVSGSLNVRIDMDNEISQPLPFSGGQTAAVSNATVNAGEETAKIALLRPTTKVWDLARIFQALQLKPNDVIQILQLLQQQGALKARIELQ